MDSDIFISFIIPTYNSQATIVECLESINNINYPKNGFEIIIVDNGSRDSTVKYAKKFTDKIFTDTSATIGKLRNIGAEKSKGEFLVFVDCDCVLPRDWVKNALEYFQDSVVGLTGSKTYTLPDNAGWVEKAWKIHLDRNEKEVKWVISRAMMVKKEIFSAVGGFDESLITCEDVDFGYRINQRYKIVSNERLAPLHLGGVTGILEFFKKESWRGRDSLKVSLKHIKEGKEVFSLLSFFYYCTILVLLLPALIATAITKNALYISVVLAGIVLPLMAICLETAGRRKQFRFSGQLFILYFVYILARIKGGLRPK